MTSEVSAILEDRISLFDIFKAIFPCGSITGAPKVSTMKVIDELEPFDRNLYCGAIGYLSPDICEFSVPIRILYGNNHKYTYHAGGAVVWDSNAEDEWEETLTKTKFLQTDFQLIETGTDDWENHIQRMKKSAAALNFKWNSSIKNIKGTKRVLLNRDGSFEIQEKTFLPIISNKIRLGRKANSANPFLYHKTTIRESAPDDVFDIIGINERGEITEGTFTNIAVQINGELYTPPVECGLLAGTFRAKLLEQGKIKEKVLYPSDLEKAEKIIKAVVEKSSVPVTLKFRKGWDNEHIVACELAQIAEKNGISAITIHGRTRTEFYTGHADWDIIKKVKESVNIPVIGNGDIIDEESAQKMFEQTGVDAIMIGRGTMGNPWIFKQIQHYLETGEKLSKPSNQEKYEILKEHIEFDIAYKGEGVALNEMRKHISWYTKNMPDSSLFRNEINHITTKEELLQKIENYFL